VFYLSRRGFPEGVSPAGPIDLQDDAAALAMSIKLTRESGVLTVLYDFEGDRQEARRRFGERIGKD